GRRPGAPPSRARSGSGGRLAFRGGGPIRYGSPNPARLGPPLQRGGDRGPDVRSRSRPTSVVECRSDGRVEAAGFTRPRSGETRGGPLALRRFTRRSRPAVHCRGGRTNDRQMVAQARPDTAATATVSSKEGCGGARGF